VKSGSNVSGLWNMPPYKGLGIRPADPESGLLDTQAVERPKTRHAGALRIQSCTVGRLSPALPEGDLLYMLVMDPR